MTDPHDPHDPHGSRGHQDGNDLPDGAWAEAWDDAIAEAGIGPDLVEVLARARAKDPSAVPFGAQARPDERELLAAMGEVEAWESSTSPASEHTHEDAHGDPELLPFTSAYRLAMDELVDLRLLEPLRPPSGRPSRIGLVRPQRARTVRRVAAAAAFMMTGAAAAAALVLAGPPGMATGRPVHAAGTMAEHIRRVEGGSAVKAGPLPTAIEPGDAHNVGTHSADPDTNLEHNDQNPEEDTEPDLDPDAPSSETETETTTARRPKRLEGEALTDALTELDRRARAAWKAGDLAEAERLFRKITKTGGRHRLVELAYGDLFALTAQRGHSLVPMWRAYLRRFPRGRYADDARAGLCRLAKESQRSTCWEAYRHDFPTGTHAP